MSNSNPTHREALILPAKHYKNKLESDDITNQNSLSIGPLKWTPDEQAPICSCNRLDCDICDAALDHWFIDQLALKAKTTNRPFSISMLTLVLERANGLALNSSGLNLGQLAIAAQGVLNLLPFATAPYFGLLNALMGVPDKKWDSKSAALSIYLFSRGLEAREIQTINSFNDGVEIVVSKRFETSSHFASQYIGMASQLCPNIYSMFKGLQMMTILKQPRKLKPIQREFEDRSSQTQRLLLNKARCVNNSIEFDY